MVFHDMGFKLFCTRNWRYLLPIKIEYEDIMFAITIRTLTNVYFLYRAKYKNDEILCTRTSNPFRKQAIEKLVPDCASRACQ